MRGIMKPGMRVRLCTPEFDCQYADLVEEHCTKWLLRLPSGHEITMYAEEFELEENGVPVLSDQDFALT